MADVFSTSAETHRRKIHKLGICGKGAAALFQLWKIDRWVLLSEKLDHSVKRPELLIHTNLNIFSDYSKEAFRIWKRIWITSRQKLLSASCVLLSIIFLDKADGRNLSE